jgi:hypothetical protein
MFAFLKSLTTAGNRLVKSLTALAETCDEVNIGIREQLAMDRPASRRKQPQALQEEATSRPWPPHQEESCLCISS